MRKLVIITLSVLMLVTVCVAMTASEFQETYATYVNPNLQKTDEVMGKLFVEPEIIEEPVVEEKVYDGTVYLTFDDGPTSEFTPQILDILKENDVKATFFVIGSYAKRIPDIIKREADEGHTVGNHSYTHQKSMFSNLTTFKNEIDKTNEVIKDAIGEYPKFFRFPYGTKVGKSYTDFLKEKELAIIKWNCESSDSHSKTIKADAILKSVKDTFKNQKEVIVIMHDTYGKAETVKALPDIIKYFKDLNYEFKAF